MILINENYTKLQSSYLFSDIAKRVKAYQEANPDKRVIRLGIGDVTQPLPAGQTTYDGGTGNNVLAVVSPPGGNALTAEPGRFLFNTTPIDLTGVGSVMPISSDGKDTRTIAAGTSRKLASLPYKTLFVSGLTIAADSSLDLADNGLVLAYGASSPLAQLTQDIVNGRDGLSGAKLLTTATAARRQGPEFSNLKPWHSTTRATCLSRKRAADSAGSMRIRKSSPRVPAMAISMP